MQRPPKCFESESDRLSVTLFKGTLLCPNGVAFLRGYGMSPSGLFKKPFEVRQTVEGSAAVLAPNNRGLLPPRQDETP